MASRKEQKEALRAQRLAAERAATAAEGRRKMIAYGAGGLLAVGAVVGLAAIFLGGVGQGSGTGERSGTTPAAGEFPEGSLPPMRIADMGAAARAARCTSRGLPSEGADHVGGPVRYRSRPPHSGNHDQVPGEDAAYTEAPRRENLVHSLEHGRVVIWFSPDLAPEARGGLKALFDEDPYHMVLAPNRDMPAQVAASAWTQVLACGRMSPAAFDAIRAFRSRFRDRGPEFVP